MAGKIRVGGALDPADALDDQAIILILQAQLLLGDVDFRQVVAARGRELWVSHGLSTG